MIIKIYTINTLWSVQTLYTRRASTWRYVLPVNVWSGKHYLFFCGTIKHLIQSIRSIIPMNKLLSFFGTVLICLCIVYAWVFIHLQYTGAQGRCQKIQPIRVAFFSFQIHCIPVCTNSDQGCVDEMNRFMDTYLLRACSTQYAVYSAWLGYKV